VYDTLGVLGNERTTIKGGHRETGGDEHSRAVPDPARPFAPGTAAEFRFTPETERSK
jgi:hypothetical protein